MLAYGRPVHRAELARLGAGVFACLFFLGVYAAGLHAQAQPGTPVQAVLELLALACVAFAGWALPGAIEGLAAGREVWYESGPVVRLNREGMEFRTRAGGDVVVFAAWDLVERCEFRPAPGGDPRWCIDAPIALPTPLSFASTWSGMVSLGQLDTRANELVATWRTLGVRTDRRLLRDALIFGTPVVVDLTRCTGVTVSRLDTAVRGWTFGRCGCDPTARPSRRGSPSSPWPRVPTAAGDQGDPGQRSPGG